MNDSTLETTARDVSAVIRCLYSLMRSWRIFFSVLAFLSCSSQVLAVPIADLTVVKPVFSGQSVSGFLHFSGAVGTPQFSIVQPPSHGTVVLDDPTTGAFTYTATLRQFFEGEVGDSFSFQVADSTGISSSQQAYLTIRTVGGRSILSTGDNSFGQCNVSGWQDVQFVVAGENHTVGLKLDGTVVATGDNRSGQTNVSGWSNIISVAAGGQHTLGLKVDGTVVAAGDNSFGQINVGDWTDIVAIAAGSNHSLGLRSDGSVIGTGYNYNWQQNFNQAYRYVSITASVNYSAGLISDGSINEVGVNPFGELIDPIDIYHRDVDPIIARDPYANIVVGSGYWHSIINDPVLRGRVVSGPDGLMTLNEITHTSGVFLDPATAYSLDNSTAINFSNLWSQALVNGWDSLIINGWDPALKSAYDLYLAAFTGPGVQVGEPIANVSLGKNYRVYVRPDGTAKGEGDNTFGQIDVVNWNLVLGVAAGLSHTVGIHGNHAPVLSANPSTLYGEPGSQITTESFLVYGSDLDGDMLHVSIVGQPNNGAVTTNLEGTLTYVPNPGFIGTDSITYRLSDGWFGGDSSEIVTITLNVSTDWDGDGLPNAWEQANGLDPLVNDAGGDLDGDGLSNLVEYQHGWSANIAETNPDLDGDGFSNVWEYKYGLDPLQDSSYLAWMDMDNDGSPTIIEYQNGTNPWLAPYLVNTVVARPIFAGQTTNYTLPWTNRSSADPYLWGVNMLIVGSPGGFGSPVNTSQGTAILFGPEMMQFQANINGDGTDSVGIAANGSGGGSGTVLQIPILKTGGYPGIAAAGLNQYGEINVSAWSGISAVSAKFLHTLALKADGTVLATGDNRYGQTDVGSWNNIVAVETGMWHSLGLTNSGMVVGVGLNNHGELDLGAWRDISAIAAGNQHSLGLKYDGTVVAAGRNDFGQSNVGDWQNIVAIAAGYAHSVGLKSDGTVVAVGRSDFGQLDVGSWRNIVAIAANHQCTMGLRSDGTVVATGKNQLGELNVSSWSGIKSIALGAGNGIGLKSDGTVVVSGSAAKGQYNANNWVNIKGVSAGYLDVFGLIN